MRQVTIVCVGAGPKTLAIAVKARVLRELGIADIRVLAVERSSVGSNWDGSEGLTDGGQTLGTNPEKDLGFPYSSSFGRLVDIGMLRYSWSAYLIDGARESFWCYSDWIDRGRPQPKHATWADYLRWAARQVELEVIRGDATGIAATDDGVVVRAGDAEYHADAAVITGPGDVRSIDKVAADGTSIFDGRDYWLHRESFRQLRKAHLAVIGAGEAAASVVSSLLAFAEETGMRVDAIARHGTLYTRGESFHENRIFSRPELWEALDDSDKDEFIRRTDRGVFSVAAQRIIDHAWGEFRVITGSVEQITPIQGKLAVLVRRSGQGLQTLHYDRVVVATGFDPVANLRRLYALSNPLPASDGMLFNGIDYHLRVADSSGGAVPIHAPALAARAQGPGLPNLSCLGTLADRVLSAYVTAVGR